MVTVEGYGKTRAFDIGCDHLGIDDSVSPKALTHEVFATVYMVGRQRCITCPTGQCDSLLIKSGSIDTIAVTPTHTAYVSNIMTQKRQHKMHPITRRDAAFTEVFAFENFLAHESDHDGVLH